MYSLVLTCGYLLKQSDIVPTFRLLTHKERLSENVMVPWKWIFMKYIGPSLGMVNIHMVELYVCNVGESGTSVRDQTAPTWPISRLMDTPRKFPSDNPLLKVAPKQFPAWEISPLKTYPWQFLQGKGQDYKNNWGGGNCPWTLYLLKFEGVSITGQCKGICTFMKISSSKICSFSSFCEWTSLFSSSGRNPKGLLATQLTRIITIWESPMFQRHG